MDLGEAYRRQDRVQEAEELYRSAIEVMEESRFTRGLALAYNNLGLACMRQNKWDMADDSFHRSIRLWQDLGEPVGQANAEDNLADAYLQQARWIEALELLGSAMDHLEGLAVTAQVEDLLSDIGQHRQVALAALDAMPSQND